jgi:hypothetical protein
VQERGDADVRAGILAKIAEVAALLEERQRTPRERIRAERVLETRMAGARIDQERQPELSHVPQPLKRRRVDESERERLDADVIPKRIPNDFQGWLSALGPRLSAESREPKAERSISGAPRPSPRQTQPTQTSRNAS